MKLIFIFAFLLDLNVARAEDPGYLLIKIAKHAYQQPGENESDVDVDTKSNWGHALFALELTENLKRQLVTSSDETKGVTLAIQTLYAMGKPNEGTETNSLWRFNMDAEGRLRIHGTPRGHEEILGQQVIGLNPTATFDVSFKNWEDIFFSASLRYVHHLSGVLIDVQFRHITADDPILKTAFLMSPQTTPSGPANVRHVPGCSGYLGRFSAQAFFQ